MRISKEWIILLGIELAFVAFLTLLNPAFRTWVVTGHRALYVACGLVVITLLVMFREKMLQALRGVTVVALAVIPKVRRAGVALRNRVTVKNAAWTLTGVLSLIVTSTLVYMRYSGYLTIAETGGGLLVLLLVGLTVGFFAIFGKDLINFVRSCCQRLINFVKTYLRQANHAGNLTGLALANTSQTQPLSAPASLALRRIMWGIIMGLCFLLFFFSGSLQIFVDSFAAERVVGIWRYGATLGKLVGVFQYPFLLASIYAMFRLIVTPEKSKKKIKTIRGAFAKALVIVGVFLFLGILISIGGGTK